MSKTSLLLQLFFLLLTILLFTATATTPNGHYTKFNPKQLRGVSLFTSKMSLDAKYSLITFASWPETALSLTPTIVLQITGLTLSDKPMVVTTKQSELDGSPDTIYHDLVTFTKKSDLVYETKFTITFDEPSSSARNISRLLTIDLDLDTPPQSISQVVRLDASITYDSASSLTSSSNMRTTFPPEDVTYTVTLIPTFAQSFTFGLAKKDSSPNLRPFSMRLRGLTQNVNSDNTQRVVITGETINYLPTPRDVETECLLNGKDSVSVRVEWVWVLQASRFILDFTQKDFKNINWDRGSDVTIECEEIMIKYRTPDDPLTSSYPQWWTLSYVDFRGTLRRQNQEYVKVLPSF